MYGCGSRERERDVKTEQRANRTDTVERIGEARLQKLLEHVRNRQNNAM